MHAIYRSMEAPLPRLVLEMSEKEREKRVKASAGFVQVDDKLFFANGWVNKASLLKFKRMKIAS